MLADNHEVRLAVVNTIVSHVIGEANLSRVPIAANPLAAFDVPADVSADIPALPDNPRSYLIPFCKACQIFADHLYDDMLLGFETHVQPMVLPKFTEHHQVT